VNNKWPNRNALGAMALAGVIAVKALESSGIQAVDLWAIDQNAVLAPAPESVMLAVVQASGRGSVGHPLGKEAPRKLGASFHSS